MHEVLRGKTDVIASEAKQSIPLRQASVLYRSFQSGDACIERSLPAVRKDAHARLAGQIIATPLQRDHYTAMLAPSSVYSGRRGRGVDGVRRLDDCFVAPLLAMTARNG